MTDHLPLALLIHWTGAVLEVVRSLVFSKRATKADGGSDVLLYLTDSDICGVTVNDHTLHLPGTMRISENNGF